MNSQVRAKYQAPKLEVQRLRELPSALAASSGCRPTPSKTTLSCSASGTGGNAAHFLSS
ncbi:MAG TPA: hypothetical protein VKP04_02330 [Ktedonobacteraceae bacterium]|nr:hypothetical protein [Ktedonobacteraceae bacterium]